jgi:hypothetical protein
MPGGPRIIHEVNAKKVRNFLEKKFGLSNRRSATPGERTLGQFVTEVAVEDPHSKKVRIVLNKGMCLAVLTGFCAHKPAKPVDCGGIVPLWIQFVSPQGC